jgi:SulP family sulfate permease
VVIVEMSAVPLLDMTALAALESILEHYQRHGIGLVLVGTTPRVRLKLRRAGIHRREGELAFVRNLVQAREKALQWINDTAIEPQV